MERESLEESIDRAIAGGGCQVVLVSSAPMPRYAYTVGARGRAGAEFCLAGAICYDKHEVKLVLETAFAAAETERALDVMLSDGFEAPELGHFTLAGMDASWSTQMLLAAQARYDDPDVKGIQLVPDETHRTIDVPDMTSPWIPAAGGPWGWGAVPWRHDAPATSHAGVDFGVLRGRPPFRATRWERDYFEAFSLHEEDVTEEDATVVPLALLVGAMPSLSFIADLAIGEHARLQDDGTWQRWTAGA